MISAASQNSCKGPLSGVRVIGLTVNVLGPVATQMLGDMGADVIKMEPLQGDPNRETGPCRNPGMPAMHMNVNRNKRSVTLNLKSAEGMSTLMRLVDTADVFVHSMRPAAAIRLGVGYDAISKGNPRIIYAFGPGYNQNGPNRDYPARASNSPQAASAEYCCAMASPGSGLPNDFVSPPVENACPAPVSTMTRAAGVRAAS